MNRRMSAITGKDQESFVLQAFVDKLER